MYGHSSHGALIAHRTKPAGRLGGHAARPITFCLRVLNGDRFSRGHCSTLHLMPNISKVKAPTPCPHFALLLTALRAGTLGGGINEAFTGRYDASKALVQFFFNDLCP